MLRRKSATWLLVAASLSILIVGGCTTVNHTYDPSTNFGPLRSYTWAPGSPIYSVNNLVEAKVRFLADPLLEKKGFTRATANPDLVISVNYSPGINGSYELSWLDLRVYRSDGQTLIWRGSASGSISTDARSSDLSNAVQGILAAFPPS
jgi:hypothetical protein